MTLLVLALRQGLSGWQANYDWRFPKEHFPTITVTHVATSRKNGCRETLQSTERKTWKPKARSFFHVTPLVWVVGALAISPLGNWPLPTGKQFFVKVSIDTSQRTKVLPATFRDDQSHSSSRNLSGPTNHVSTIAKLGEKITWYAPFPCVWGRYIEFAPPNARGEQNEKITIILLFLSPHMSRVPHHKLE